MRSNFQKSPLFLFFDRWSVSKFQTTEGCLHLCHPSPPLPTRLGGHYAINLNLCLQSGRPIGDFHLEVSK